MKNLLHVPAAPCDESLCIPIIDNYIDITKSGTFMLLFRSLEDDKPSFHGIIWLDFAKKCLELLLNIVLSVTVL